MIREHKRAEVGAGAPFTPSLAPRRARALQSSVHDRAGSTAAPPVVGEVLRSSGRPLDPATRAFMEPRLGQSFGAVQVHAGGRAAASALAVGALAYTVGEKVVLGPDAPPPGTPDGRRLIAHELVHVAQSRASGRGTGDLFGVTLGDPHDAAEREADAVAAEINQPPGADGTFQPVGLSGRAAGPVARRQPLPTTTVYGRADRGALVVHGLRAELDAAAREFAVPPELVGALVLHESQASERSFFGGGGLANWAERAEAFFSSDPSIGIGQMKVGLASGLRTRHPALAGGGSVVDDLLDRQRAVRYVAAHLGELGGQIDSWLASQGVTPTAEERRDLMAVAYNMGWVSLRDRNLLDPGLGPDVPSRISALRSRNDYLSRTIGNLRLVTDALAGRRPSGTSIRTLGMPPWFPRYRR